MTCNRHFRIGGTFSKLQEHSFKNPPLSVVSEQEGDTGVDFHSCPIPLPKKNQKTVLSQSRSLNISIVAVFVFSCQPVEYDTSTDVVFALWVFASFWFQLGANFSGSEPV